MAKQIFKVNVKKSVASTGSSGVYADIKPDSNNLLRVLPSVQDEIIFYPVSYHYNVKRDNGKTFWPACTHQHGDDRTGRSCYFCKLSRIAEEQLVPLPVELRSKFKDDQCALRSNRKFYAQVLVGTKDDRGGHTWSRPLIIGLPKTAADGVNEILSNQDEMGEPLATDPDEGQPVIIKRSSTNRYTVQRTSSPAKLDDIYPNWLEEMYDDVVAKVKLEIHTPEEQKELLKLHTFPGLDWDMLENDYDL